MAMSKRRKAANKAIRERYKESQLPKNKERIYEARRASRDRMFYGESIYAGALGMLLGFGRGK